MCARGRAASYWLKASTGAEDRENIPLGGNMPFIHSANSRLYYEVHGEGEVVVLLHGVGGNHASWFHQIDAWRRHYAVIVFDARGFGNSTDAEGLGRDAFVDDLELLLDTLGIPSAHLVAQSMGGGTAVQFACRAPQRVRSLVLADTLVGLEIPEDLAPWMQENAARVRALRQSERVLGATFREAHPAWTQLYLELASFNGTTLNTLTGTQRLCSPQTLADTGVPVMFLVGEEDILFPPRAVHRIHREIAGSRYFVIPGAGHSAYFEHPEVFNGLVEEWLADCA
ncbi:TPA: alpha/beta hydrolase [Pseudomonas aeruginosa]|nr:alpha/beta hydrolase [Pseudomonas aeruginosa]